MCHQKLLAYCACLSLPLAIWSATAPASDAVRAQAQSTAVHARAGVAHRLREIIVTAERRRTTVQNTPVTIQAISGATLAESGTTNINALQMLSPDLHILSTGNNPSAFIRGAGSVVSDQRGDSAVSYSIDGVPVARPLSVNGSLFDIKRVEIVEGPQGTLYGRNAAVGAINVISNDPILKQYSGSASLTAGNYNLFHTTGVVNLPVGNTFALRGAFETERHDGYLTSGANDADNVAARLSALWKPNDSVSAVIRGMYYRDTGVGVGDVPLKSSSGSFLRPSNPWYVAAGIENNNNTVGTDGHQRISVGMLDAEIDLDLGPITATIIPGYVSTKYRALAYDGGFRKYYNTPDRQESLEARLTSNGATRLQWVAGLFYLHDHQSGMTDLGVTTFNYAQTTYSKLDLGTYAAYGQATYRVTSKFHILGGLRYTHDQKDMAGALSLVSLSFTPLAPGPPIFGSLVYNNVSYKAGIDYDVASDHLLYANVATGYKAGGFNPGTPPNTYKPEHMTAYSIGSKNMFLRHRVLLNIEGWYWDYRNVDQYQFGMANPFGNIQLLTYNAAKLVSKGIEAQMEFALAGGGRLSLAPAYTDATFQSFSLPAFIFGPFDIPASNLAGTPDQFAPRWSANLGYQQRIHLKNGATLVGMISSQLKTSETITATPVLGYRVPGTSVTDLSLTYQSASHPWSIEAWVKNVENTPLLVWGGNTPAGFWGHVASPRTFGVTLRAWFGQ